MAGPRVSPEKAAKLADREWIVQKYVTDRLGLREVGALIGVSETSVRHALISFGIPRRRGGSSRPEADALLADAEWMRTRYAHIGIEGMSEELHVGRRRIRKALDDAGIKRLPATAPIAARVDLIIAARDAEWRAVVDRVVADLGGDPDIYAWPDAAG